MGISRCLLMNAWIQIKHKNTKCIRRFYSSHFNNIPIEKEFVQAVIDVFSNSSYPMALLNFVSDEYFKEKDIKDKFMLVLKELGEELPKSLK